MTKVASDVSIVSANYNNGAFLNDYFDSIINSNMLPFECIICDDGSTDNSQEIIKQYAKEYDWIKPHFFTKNKGVAHATNAAINLVKTDFVLRLDPDDILLPNRIENQVNFMRENTAIDVLGGNCIYFESETGKTLQTSNFPSGNDGIKKLFYIGENGVLNGTTMIKTKWFQTHQYRQEMVWAEDYDLFARMLHDGANFAGQAEALTKVRIHTSSATTNLEFDTFKKANELSKKLFNNTISNRQLKNNYKHVLHYRKYLISNNIITKKIALFKSIMYRPDKIIKRIWKR